MYLNIFEKGGGCLYLYDKRCILEDFWFLGETQDTPHAPERQQKKTVFFQKGGGAILKSPLNIILNTILNNYLKRLP